MDCFILRAVWPRIAAGVFAMFFIFIWGRPAHAELLSLDAAWQRAEAANPALQAEMAKLQAASGQSQDARAPLWNNPTVSGEWLRRRIPEPDQGPINTRDWSVGISQTFELAGQQGLRRDLARDNEIATQADIGDVRRRLRMEVAQRFFQVLGLQSRLRMEQQTLKLITDAAAAVHQRFVAGEDTRLDDNLAAVEAGRASDQIRRLRDVLIQARAELANLLQLPPAELPTVRGELASPLPPYTLDTLLAAARQRPDRRAAALRMRMAEAQLRLERASLMPDVTVGLSYGHEGTAFRDETLAGVNLSLPIPLFRRNATGIGRAISNLTQRQIEQRALHRDIPAQIRALWQRHENLRARIRALDREVLPRLKENQRLSQVAYREGEIDLLQLLLVNRQVLDGQRDLLDAQSALQMTRIALESAAGWPRHTVSEGVRP